MRTTLLTIMINPLLSLVPMPFRLQINTIGRILFLQGLLKEVEDGCRHGGIVRAKINVSDSLLAFSEH